ncbi:hypothetical protein OM075_24430 [Marinilabiliaceae bacterium AAT]|uniref:Uncharacterized protein n=2 Tax=Plebeiibacterium sediminum TaxID=2992112 RepID=A0AAE3M9B8_9BACT|nr:hypothetical protein [Plebeiobacterium sediminum]
MYKSYHGIIAYEFHSGITLSFGQVLKVMFYTLSFKVPIVIVLSIVGLFIPRRLGWIFANGYFSYILFNMSLVVLPNENVEWYYYSIGFVPLGLIVLLNRQKIIEYYNIKKTELFTMNLLVLMLGLIYTLGIGYLNLYYRISPLDVIYNRLS